MKERLCLFVCVLMPISNIVSAQSVIQPDSVASKEVQMEEAMVKAMLVRHDSYSDEYRMFPKLTQGATDVYDVLSRLPGVRYNRLSNTISVRMDNNVLIEVDGHRVTQEYLQALPLDRISRMQVVYVPSARYTTEGFRYVINIKLKSDYEGHDLYLGNYAMISAGNNNGSDVIANEQPKAQYTYSGKKVDITAGYGLAAISWNYPISYSRDYKGLATVETGNVDEKSPNDKNTTDTHAANLGIDWQFGQNQTLSYRGTYRNDKVKHHSTYDITQNDMTNGMIDKSTELSKENSKASDIAGALYYQGMFQNGWTIYSALGYDRMRDNLNYEYSEGNFTNAAHYRNSKDYYRGELDFNYSISDLLTLNFGYRGVWNRYKTRDRESSMSLSDNQERRHNGYVFLDWAPKENILLHIGTGMETIHKKGLEERRNWVEFLPHATATWQLSNQVQLMAEYTTKMEYPSLYQVSATLNPIDRWLTLRGNPLLSPSRRQTVSLQGTFWESLILGAEYVHVRNAITDWYEQTGANTYLKTFANARNQELRAFAAYEWAITEGLTWNNIVQWQWQHVGGNGLSNHASNISFHSNVEYWIKPAALLAGIEYMREMQKVPLLQGWQHYGQDLWQISLKKSFFDKSLSISLNYVPPIHSGVRTNQKSCVNTAFLNQNLSQNLKTYDNLLMVRISWRFNKGRKKQRQVQEYEFGTENKQDKGLL